MDDENDDGDYNDDVITSEVVTQHRSDHVIIACYYMPRQVREF